jgi:lipopolysaccharide export LptBFGC system permease protein LptF
MILTKLIGAGCILLGFFLVVIFPDSSELQPPNMFIGATLIGILLIAFGIYLLKV